jgi:ribosomal protein S18 acetylase RimI-like enzyme
MTDVRIVATAEEYASGFNAVVDYVARERRYIGFVEGPSLESTREFVRSILGGAGLQFLAVAPDSTVVGWCDVIRNPLDGFRHVGRLGMGLLPEYRRRGLGRLLVTKAILSAHEAGIERVELEVFASNEVAIRLYRALGFVTEGIKRRARKLDGQYEDNVLMALIDDTKISNRSV